MTQHEVPVPDLMPGDKILRVGARSGATVHTYVVERDESSIQERLESLRAAIRAESMSWGELAELQSLVDYVEFGDVELLEWAGVTEEQAREEGRL